MLCLVLALIQGNDRDKGWTSGYILTLFAVSAIALVAFVVGELRMKNPMADPRLFKIPSFTGGAIVAFTLSAGFYSLLFFLALYLQNTLGFDALNAGVRFLAISGMLLIGAPLAGRLTDRIGPKPLLVVGSAGLVISVLLMTRISATNFAQDSWTILLPAFILGGLASGIMNPPISTLAVGTVERRRAGMASGISGLARQLGTAFGIALLGAILTSRYNSTIHDRVLAAQGPAWAHVPAMARQGIANGIQAAGTTAGSLGLPGRPPEPLLQLAAPPRARRDRQERLRVRHDRHLPHRGGDRRGRPACIAIPGPPLRPEAERPRSATRRPLNRTGGQHRPPG